MLQTTQVLQGRYQLQKQLGNNPGRQTWLATDIKTSPAETVIVKLLAFSPQMQWEEFKLFEREAQVLKSLNHLRIPKYRNYFSLDQHTGDGLCWFALVQDSIPGHSLQQLLDEGKRFTQEQVRSIATQVLEILIYLHGLNPPVLHRDIKPSNLIWREDVETRNFASVHLVDFGAVADPTTVEGATFTVVGTAGYAPLEQFYGKTVPASDLYALGATLIHLLTGTSPADLPQSNLRIQFRDRVSLDPSFVRWIESLTEPDLDHRFSSASQALEALKTGNSLGYSERISCKPSSSRIRLQKSRRQLVIQIPRRIAYTDFVKFGVKLIQAIGFEIFVLLLLSLIVLGAVVNMVSNFDDSLSEVIFSLGKLIFDTGVISIPLIFFLGYPWFRLLVALNKALLACFGYQSLYFDQISLEIGRQLFIFHGERCQLCQISDIQNVQAIPGEGVVIQVGTQRYVFGQELTAPEGNWLVEEIQKWLKFSSATTPLTPLGKGGTENL
jgi:serine/threonine protein kinase